MRRSWQHAYEMDDIVPGRLAAKGVIRCRCDQFLSRADHHVSVKGQAPEQFRTETFLADSLRDHKRSRRANVDYAVLLQLIGDNTGTKSPVPAHVHALEEGHERHRVIIENQRRYCSSLTSSIQSTTFPSFFS